MPHRPGHSRYGGSTPGPVGMGSAPRSSPKSFVDRQTKSKTQSVSTSDVATGKFTGGTQKSTPKPKVDKTFEDKNTTSSEQLTGRDAAIKTYSTTGLKNLGEHRKKEVEKILSSTQSSEEKRREIKKRNLRGAIPGLMEDKTRDKKLFVPPSQSPFIDRKIPWSEQTYSTKFTQNLLSSVQPLTNRMTYDANNVWGINNYQSDAMRHLMYSTIYPVQAAGHEALDPTMHWTRNIQDMHNNKLRGEVLSRVSKMKGGTTYENIRKAAFDMVMEQEKRTADGLEPLDTLPVTDIAHEKKLYPNLDKLTYTKSLMEPGNYPAATWGTKASLQGYTKAAQYYSNQLINWAIGE